MNGQSGYHGSVSSWCSSLFRVKTKLKLHGSSGRQRLFPFCTAARSCLNFSSSDSWVAPSRPSHLLTLLLWCFDSSSTPVCHPPTGSDRVARPHCHLPVWSQRKSPAGSFLAEGGESGKNTTHPELTMRKTVWSFYSTHIIKALFTTYTRAVTDDYFSNHLFNQLFSQLCNWLFDWLLWQLILKKWPILHIWVSFFLQY